MQFWTNLSATALRGMGVMQVSAAPQRQARIIQIRIGPGTNNRVNQRIGPVSLV